jgi:DNA-binding HxlR family transcriptional regulator
MPRLEEQFAVTREEAAMVVALFGDRWTPLIVIEAFRGAIRFSQFRQTLDVTASVLTSRLCELVDLGILERRGYQEVGERRRPDYHLTLAGRSRAPVLCALARWARTQQRLHRPHVCEGATT